MGILRVTNSSASDCILGSIFLEEDGDPFGTQDRVIDLAPGQSIEIALPVGVWDVIAGDSTPAACFRNPSIHRDVAISAGSLEERVFDMELP